MSLRANIETLFGWDFRRDHDARRLEAALAALPRELRTRLAEAGLDALDPDARTRIAESLVVGETYFFRHEEQLVAALLHATERSGAGRPLRVLCAGCASGEEVYSVTMIAAELDHVVPGVEVLGVDVSPAFLALARARTYRRWSLRRASAARRARFFEPVGDRFRVVEAWARGAQFERANLAASDAAVYRRGPFDLVLCRNVLMYFSSEARARVLRSLASILAPDGVIAFAAAEASLVNEQFQRLAPLESGLHAPAPDGATPAASPNSPRPPRTAVSRPPAPRRKRPVHPAAPATPPPTEPGAWVAKTLLVVARDPEAALALCTPRFQQQDPIAHYLAALAYERQGDRGAAREHDRSAIALDPAFAFPTFHLGVLAADDGARDEARQLLWLALELFDRESEERIALLGEDADRERLARACAAKIRGLA